MKTLFVLKDDTPLIRSSIKEIIKNLNLDIEFAWKNTLKQEHFKNKDIIITIGGDGTFLSASHFTQVPILGVNSNKEKSEGILCTIHMEELKEKLIQILNNNYNTNDYPRVQVKINCEKSCTLTELALNEVYIGNINPHHPSNYVLNYKGNQENQKSSGILIATGTGSTAWYKSMSGKPFSRTKKQLRFIIREPFLLKIYNTKIRKGKIKPQEKLEITNLTHHCLLAVDSIRTYTLSLNDKVEITLGKPIKVIQ